jgi:hypothetical protein
MKNVAALDTKVVEGMVLKSKITVAIRAILELGGDPFNVTAAVLDLAVRDLGDRGRLLRAEFVELLVRTYVDQSVHEALSKHLSAGEFSELVKAVLAEEQFGKVSNREIRRCYDRLCGSLRQNEDSGGEKGKNEIPA